MALKGRKSLPNRLSSVNSYNFVIRENCRKCKTTVPNCDLSKLMPLITVAGETWGKLELGPRPSLLPWGGLMQATLPQLARQLRLAHVVLPPPWQASLERAGFSPPSEQPFVGSRLWWRKSGSAPGSCWSPAAWNRAGEPEQREGRQEAADVVSRLQGMKKGVGVWEGGTSIWFWREIQSPVCQPVQEDNQKMAYRYPASGVPLAVTRPLCSPYLQDLEKQKHVPAQIFSQRRSRRQKSHPVGSLQQVTALLLQAEEKRLCRSRLCLTSLLCNSFRRR